MSDADRFIGDFRLVRKLGEGGMGVVYEAEQQHPRRPVALKVVRGGAHVTPETLKLFQREAQTLARLRHPGIAALYGTGATDDGLHFFAMELVRGVTLQGWLTTRPSGPLTAHELKLRLSLFKKICDAVAYAHQRGVIHRDLKPANVLIPSSVAGSSIPDEVPDVKVLDFGLARITDSDVQATTYLTEVGRIQGTLPYMSPEQVRGNPDEIDLRTDVYSLGVILYEMVTGSLPYDVSKAQLPEAVRVICEEPPKSISASFSGTRHLDADIVTIAGKCLEKEAARRYQSAAQLGDDVQRYLSDQPILARPPSTMYQFKKLAARHRGAVAFVATVFVLVTALAVTSTVQAIRIAKEKARANAEAETARQVSEFLEGLFRVSDPSEARGNEIKAKDILDQGAARIDRELENQPELRLRLGRVIGKVYMGLGLYAQGEARLESVLKLMDERDEEDLEYAKVLNVLGMADAARGRYEHALRRQERALALRERVAPHNHVSLAVGLYYRGLLQCFVADRQAGVGTLRRSLAELDAAKVDNPRLRIWIMNDLATFGGASGRASDMMREVQRLRELYLPIGDPDRILGENNVGWQLLAEGDPAGARPWLEKAVDEARRVFPSRHPSTAAVLHSMGELERRDGHLDRATQLLEESMAALAGSESKEQAGMADPLLSLALIDDAEGREEAALERLRQAIHLIEQTQGIEHVALVPILEPYERILRKTGQAADAESVRKRSEGIRSRSTDSLVYISWATITATLDE